MSIDEVGQRELDGRKPRRRGRVLAGGVLALVLAASGFWTSPALAAGSDEKTAKAGTVEVCEDEALSVVRQDGSRLTADELARATQMVQDFCNESASNDELEVAPFGIAYGNYIRNNTQAWLVDCPCGSDYREFSIDVLATGVPYNGQNLNNLNVIWKVEPGSGAWQYGPSRGITTSGTLPTVSGTMSTWSYVTGRAAVYKAGTTHLETIQSSAP